MFPKTQVLSVTFQSILTAQVSLNMYSNSSLGARMERKERTEWTYVHPPTYKPRGSVTNADGTPRDITETPPRFVVAGEWDMQKRLLSWLHFDDDYLAHQTLIEKRKRHCQGLGHGYYP